MESENKSHDEKIIKSAMLKLATGYDIEERVVEADKEGKPKKVKVIKKHVPPDKELAQQILYMMKNDKW